MKLIYFDSPASNVKANRIRELENKEKKTPTVAVTAGAFQEDKQKAQDAGADYYIRKPFKEYEIFDSIKDCLEIHNVYK
jgi:CheY-like chemotaxis protein